MPLSHAQAAPPSSGSPLRSPLTPSPPRSLPSPIPRPSLLVPPSSTSTRRPRRTPDSQAQIPDLSAGRLRQAGRCRCAGAPEQQSKLMRSSPTFDSLADARASPASDRLLSARRSGARARSHNRYVPQLSMTCECLRLALRPRAAADPRKEPQLTPLSLAQAAPSRPGRPSLAPDAVHPSLFALAHPSTLPRPSLDPRSPTIRRPRQTRSDRRSPTSRLQHPHGLGLALRSPLAPSSSPPPHFALPSALAPRPAFDLD